MNKQAKQNRQINKLSYVLIALIFLISIFFAITLAAFTSIDSITDVLNFGTIEINAKSDNLVTSSSTRTSGKFLPGDNVVVNFNLENNGEDAYYLVSVTASSSGFDSVIGIYAGKIDTDTNKIANKIGDITDDTTKKVGSIGSGLTESNTKTCNLDFLNIDSSMMNKTATIKVTVYSIQQANMGETDAEAQTNAFDKLLEVMRGNFDPNTPVIVDGIKYYYNEETDSFTVGNYFTFFEDNMAASEDVEAQNRIIASLGSGIDESLYKMTEVRIKAEINGKPVTKIADAAFCNMDFITGELLGLNIEGIIIEGNIESLGIYAFSLNNLQLVLFCGDCYMAPIVGDSFDLELCAYTFITAQETYSAFALKQGAQLTGLLGDLLGMTTQISTGQEVPINGETIIVDVYTMG